MDIINKNNKNVLRVTAQELNKLNKKADEDIQPPQGLPSTDEFFGAFVGEPFAYFRRVITPLRKTRNFDLIREGLAYMDKKFQSPSLREDLLQEFTGELENLLVTGKIDKEAHDSALDFWSDMLKGKMLEPTPVIDYKPEPKAKPSNRRPWGELHDDPLDISEGEDFEIEFSTPNEGRKIQDSILDHVAKEKANIISRFESGEIDEAKKQELLGHLALRQKEMLTEFAKAQIRMVLANNKQSIRMNKEAWSLIGIASGWMKSASPAPAAPPTTKPTTKPGEKTNPKPRDPMKPQKIDEPAPAKAKKTEKNEIEVKE